VAPLGPDDLETLEGLLRRLRDGTGGTT
jgi:hypothetical protein